MVSSSSEGHLQLPGWPERSSAHSVSLGTPAMGDGAGVTQMAMFCWSLYVLGGDWAPACPSAHRKNNRHLMPMHRYFWAAVPQLTWPGSLVTFPELLSYPVPKCCPLGEGHLVPCGNQRF